MRPSRLPPHIRQVLPASCVAGGLAILLCVISLLAIQQFRAEIGLVRWVHDDHDILNHASELKRLILQAETGQRGYLLTDDPAYLAPFQHVEQRLPHAEAELAALVRHDPAEDALYHTTAAPIAAKMDELRQTLRVHAINRDAAVAIVRTSMGHRLTVLIFAQLDRLRLQEEAGLARHRAVLDRARVAMAELALGGTGLGLLCLLGGGLVLRRAFRRLRESEERYRLIAHHTSDVIVRLDLDLAPVYVSPSCVGVCGFTAAELLGRTPFADCHADDAPSLDRQLRRVLSGRTDAELMTFRMRHRAGHFIWAETAVNLVRGQDGRPEALIASLRDISSRRTQADELRTVNLELERLARHLARARDRAEQASSAKTRFLAGMSHELRTPLNGIIGYAHLLRLEGGLTDTQAARVASMLTAGEHLLGMINHVLELSEIEADQIEVRIQDVDLAEVAGTCLALVRPSADLKRLGLRLEVEGDAPGVIATDPARLRQILVNLLGNAVKFTPEGAVTLRLRPGRETSRVRLEIIDDGPGIAPDQVHRLFVEFDRLGAGEGPGDAAVEGAGLGLAISARLASLLGGELGYADNAGGGSLFWLDLPVGEVVGPSAASASPPPGRGRALRVLVADDVAMNRDIAIAFLRAAGHEAIGVEGGLDAIEAASSGGFDAVLMDVRMPGIDGLEAARRIRALPAPAGAVPIVALTAQAFAEQVEECRTAGMNGHLAKPFAPEALLAAVEQVVAIEEIDEAAQANVDREEAALAAMPLFDPSHYEVTARFLDSEALTAYLGTIAERAAALLAGLRDAGGGDLATASAAHEFAGSAGLFGFARPAELARRFERAIQTNSPDRSHLGRRLADAITDILPLMHERARPVRAAPRPARASSPGPPASKS